MVCAAKKLPLTGPDRFRAALAGDDTLPPGTLARLRSSPKLGPFTVDAIATIEVYGGEFEIRYRLCYTVSLPGGQFEERTFWVSGSNVFVQEGDNPEPLVVPDPNPPGRSEYAGFGDGVGTGVDGMIPFGSDLTEPAAFVKAALRFVRGPEGSDVSSCGRFSIQVRPVGTFAAHDAKTGVTHGPFYSRTAAELWCQLQLANERPSCGKAAR